MDQTKIKKLQNQIEKKIKFQDKNNNFVIQKLMLQILTKCVYIRNYTI